jgi:hypothetical protein
MRLKICRLACCFHTSWPSTKRRLRNRRFFAGPALGWWEEAVYRTFQTFYDFNVTYDMTRQWIAMPGPFVYDYRWLSSTASHEAIKSFADEHFEHVYGVEPDSFEIV